MTAKIRFPLLAVVGCLVLSACSQSAPSAPAALQDSTPATEQTQSLPVPSVDARKRAAPATLTEIDEAARSVEMSVSGMCSFDKINGESFGDVPSVRVQRSSDFSIAGWLVDKREMVRPQGVLRIQEANGGRAWEVNIGPGIGRGDVGRYLKQPELKNAGFQVQADLSSLPPGEYSLSLNHYSGKRLVTCDKGKKILVGS